MEWYLKHRLKKLGHLADPDKEFVRRLGERLNMAPPRWAGLPIWKLAAVPSLALLVTLGFTGAYAYASDNVLPGHPLYQVRQNLEKVEEKINVSPAAKALVAVKHLERRLHEDTVLFERSQKLPKARLDDFKSKLDVLMDQVGKLDGKQREPLDRKLDVVANGYALLATDASKTVLDAKEQAEMLKELEANDASLQKKVEAMDTQRRSTFKHLKEKTKAGKTDKGGDAQPKGEDEH